MPLTNWQPHGSYIAPITVPSTGPNGGTTLCLPPISQEWLPIIVGCLDQLQLPTTWGAVSDATMEQVLSWSQQLKLLVAQAGPCMELRWSDADCAVEQSFDAGATWAKLPGWPVGPPACFVGATGATGATGAMGATGATGPSVPTIPPNPQGATADQQACNIAAFLASDVVNVSITQTLSAIAASTAVVDLFGSLLGALGILTIVGSVTVLALEALYTAIQAGTASHYTSAVADPVFKSDVQCAIYNAIKADGYVTSGNFATVLTNVGAISYTYPDVVTSVHDYISNLGVTGLQALQLQGSLYVGDCSACRGAIVGLNAVALGGATSKVITMATDVIGGANFTLAGWCSHSAPGGTQALGILGYDGVHSEYAFLNWNGGTNSVDAQIICADGSNVTTHSGRDIAGGAAHLVAMIRSTSTLFVQVDNNAAVSAGGFSASSGVNHAGGKTMLGAVDTAGSDQFAGKLWNWAFWPRALSGTELNDWYAAGSQAVPPLGYTHWWQMSEGSGATVHDVSSGDDGTITAPVTWSTHP